MFRIFPMLLVPIIAYALIAAVNGIASHDVMEKYLQHYSSFHMFSGETWDFTLSDLLILIALGCLFIEVVKSTRTSRRELINHALSAVVFVIALVLFIVSKAFSTSAFFFIVVMAAFDVVAGYTIGVVAAEHDLGMGKAGTD